MALGSLAFAGAASGQQLAAARERDPQESPSEHRIALVLEGFVLDPQENPAEGALVVSSAGGKAVTGVDGSYRIEVPVPREATSVRLTAVRSAGGSLSASVSVALSARTPVTRVAPLHLRPGTSCSPSWLPTFGGAPGTDAVVRALTVYDDGSGPALYAGGTFLAAGGVLANRVARWDGTSWSALGSGMDGHVQALAVHDDGGGPALYAGGAFTSAGGAAANRIAKWDGASWSALGSGTNGPVQALTVYDDGSGPALHAGGDFTDAGGAAASRIASWNGTSWSALGSGTNGPVRALTVYDDGGGAALHAGGDFTDAGGVAANRIARWNGTSWSALASGMSSGVRALTVFDDGGGPALYAGGIFMLAGGAAASGIARWDGTSWSALGSGIGGVSTDVNALTVYDDGGGPALCAGGEFTSAGGAAASRIARWDGTSWSALAGGIPGGAVYALSAHDDGSGPALLAGGFFSTAGDVVSANRIASWDGAAWSALGDGLDGTVLDVLVFDDGTGPALYAGGLLRSVGGLAEANRIARWDGTGWSALGSGIGSGILGAVYALAVYDDGSGPALYAGGDFTSAGGAAANRIAKWDGASWSALASGMNGLVQALTVYDDGSGAALFAGGSFTSAGGVAANRIAKWNGTSWSALGGGADSLVRTLTVHDDGGGAVLFAGGFFTSVGGVAASRIARWNGASWSALGGGMNDSVDALFVYDDGSGPKLHAGGFFTTAGGVAANRVARWDGTSWSPLGTGLGGAGAPTPRCFALEVFDDGSGPALYASGDFTTAGGLLANRIARWDGASWSPLGGGMSGPVRALAVFDGGGGPALLAGGDFRSALDSGDSYLAKWGCPVDTTAPVLACPLTITRLDRAPSPGEFVNFAVTATDDLDPAPVVLCVPPSGSLFPRGTTLVTCTATDAAGNQTTCQFPVTVRIHTRSP